jgi:hypothetical protein
VIDSPSGQSSSICLDVDVPPGSYGEEHSYAKCDSGWRRGVVLEGRSFVSYSATNSHVVFVRTDGAEVNMIREGWHDDSRCHRVWAAFLPGERFPLSFDRWHSRMRSPRLFKTPVTAMQMLDREFPMIDGDAVEDDL